nr:probable WRKY transcription factor 7 [Ipomoea batatas]
MDGWSGAVDGHRFFFSNPVVTFPVGVAGYVFLTDDGAGHVAGGFLVAVVGFNNGGLHWWPSAIVADPCLNTASASYVYSTTTHRFFQAVERKDSAAAALPMTISFTCSPGISRANSFNISSLTGETDSKLIGKCNGSPIFPKFPSPENLLSLRLP